MNASCKVGLFSIGLAAYWSQFPGLRERLAGYGAFVGQKLQSLGAQVVDAGHHARTVQKFATVNQLECKRL